MNFFVIFNCLTKILIVEFCFCYSSSHSPKVEAKPAHKSGVMVTNWLIRHKRRFTLHHKMQISSWNWFRRTKSYWTGKWRNIGKEDVGLFSFKWWSAEFHVLFFSVAPHNGHLQRTTKAGTMLELNLRWESTSPFPALLHPQQNAVRMAEFWTGW